MATLDTLGSRTIKRYDNVDEFMAQLRKSNPTWWSDSSSKCEWIFRGISGYPDYKLVPKAWREPFCKIPEITFSEIKRQAIQFKSKVCEQSNAEVSVLHHFAHLADQLGFDAEKNFAFSKLKIWDGPGGYTNDMYGDIPDSILNCFLQQHSTGPLAQHYDAPTRLLDWTENPLVAIYFAAQSGIAITGPLSGRAASSQEASPDVSSGHSAQKKALRSPANPQHRQICVWALNTAITHDRNPVKIWQRCGLTVVRSERSRNPYLKAQEGLFTMRRIITYDMIDFNGPLDLSLESLFEAEKDDEPPALIGHVIGTEHCEELLKILSRENISEPYLMPDLRNVAKHVNDQRQRSQQNQ